MSHPHSTNDSDEVLDCESLNSKAVPCPICGKSMYKNSKQCRDCYRKAATARAIHTCPSCGGPMPQTRAERCRACYFADRTANAIRPICVDCGKQISWQVGVGRGKRKPNRCWDCEVIRRRESRGNTVKHRLGAPIRAILRQWPCTICGYDLVTSEIHRIVPATGYVWGNIAPLCARCHTEIHYGATPHPEPITMEMYLATITSTSQPI